MEKKYTIAIDAMGGDNAPDCVIAGLDSIYDYLVENQIFLLIFGDMKVVAPIIAKYPRLNEISTLIQADEVVQGDDKPSKIIRSGRQTSMWKAIESVRNKEADAVVSGGNTGCLMGISRILISMIDGIRRPAITTLLPSETSYTTMLDLGANTECDENNIFQFAIMGSLYSKIILGVDKPKVGILNIGSESGKGFDYLSMAAEKMQTHKEKLCFDYYGFVEGDDIFKGKVDVITTDGFTGNVALKTLEGTAKFITTGLKKSYHKSLIAMLGGLISKKSLNDFKSSMDPRRYNGAVFLGLNGIVVKSHGGTDAFGFSNAVKYAVRLVVNDFETKVQKEIEKVKE
ncbi:MAG: phosphate acyltransferase PlsX [Alphaproteobacteria bacterium]